MLKIRLQLSWPRLSASAPLARQQYHRLSSVQEHSFDMTFAFLHQIPLPDETVGAAKERTKARPPGRRQKPPALSSIVIFCASGISSATTARIRLYLASGE
jgi:hypothetical protein